MEVAPPTPVVRVSPSKEPERTNVQPPVIVPVSPVHVHHYHFPEASAAPSAEDEKPRMEVVPPLTSEPVKEPEKINKEINESPSNVNFPVNSFPTRPLKKLPQKMKFKGKPGRQRTEAQVEELLTFAQSRGVFPNGISDQMQRYYRREYPEYFRKGKKRKKVQAHRPAPIDISARRTGTDV